MAENKGGLINGHYKGGNQETFGSLIDQFATG